MSEPHIDAQGDARNMLQALVRRHAALSVLAGTPQLAHSAAAGPAPGWHLIASPKLCTQIPAAICPGMLRWSPAT